MGESGETPKELSQGSALEAQQGTVPSVGMIRVAPDGTVVSQTFSEALSALDLAGEMLDESVGCVWVHLTRPDPEIVREIGTRLGLHELSIEDVNHAHQRPKVEFFENYAFVVFHEVSLGGLEDSVGLGEVDVFVGANWVLSVDKSGGLVTSRAKVVLSKNQTVASFGAAAILFGLLDQAVDGYFKAADRFNDYFDAVSEELFDAPLTGLEHRQWFTMRRSLGRFKRHVVPLREELRALTRSRIHGESLVPLQLEPYFQNLFDHMLRIETSLDDVRDLVSTIVETDLSLREFRQGIVTKKLTSWAAIIAVPTLITGFYGMNVPFPGDGTVAGVFTSVGLMVLISLALYVAFKKREWL